MKGENTTTTKELPSLPQKIYTTLSKQPQKPHRKYANSIYLCHFMY